MGGHATRDRSAWHPVPVPGWGLPVPEEDKLPSMMCVFCLLSLEYAAPATIQICWHPRLRKRVRPERWGRWEPAGRPRSAACVTSRKRAPFSERGPAVRSCHGLLVTQSRPSRSSHSVGLWDHRRLSN